MRSLIIIFLLATCLFHTSRCMQVTESGYSFPLAVKTLKKLMESDMSTNPLDTYSESASLCTNPKLPREFAVVYEKNDTGTISQNLASDRHTGALDCNHPNCDSKEAITARAVDLIKGT
ncbi:putative guanylin-like [Triplophysa rosa]|uniref:Guanylin-like n=1 Tax=Triplophysa rosa TaxID=992332 RepID=A0A9W7WBM3_TRIRA|nr:putative guanylin-like [Triplophysa rosa]